MDGITRYRVTDLELHSAEDLTALAAALEAQGLRVTQRALQIAETSREWFRIAETRVEFQNLRPFLGQHHPRIKDPPKENPFLATTP